MSTPIKNMSLSQYLDYVAEINTNAPDEKIVEGKATIREVLTELTGEIKHPTYNRRLGRYLERNKREIKPFESNFHKQQFEHQITKKNCSDNRYMAAMYLLTADEKTWRVVREEISKNGINYMAIENIPADDGYELFQVAKDLTDETCHITLADIAASQITKPGVFMIISKALAICRYGVGAVGIKPINPHEEEVVIFKLSK